MLVGFYDKNDDKHTETIEFFKKISTLKDIELCCSDFMFVEFAKKMIEKPNISKADALMPISEMLNLNTIGKKYPFSRIKLQEKYEIIKGAPLDVFTQFFFDLQDTWVNIKGIKEQKKGRPHLADVIHATIMKKSKIKEIVTFNDKHFKKIKKIKTVLPRDVLKNQIPQRQPIYRHI
jgi:predicted nucleic acid-binding protein